jgi:hypothetical protein
MKTLAFWRRSPPKGERFHGVWSLISGMKSQTARPKDEGKKHPPPPAIAGRFLIFYLF